MNDASPAPRLRSAAILSPHRDDAAFSCGLLLTLLLRHGVPVTILNVFTRSSYAPYVPAGISAAEITDIRRSEDEALLRRLGTACHLHDLAELDAPLRLGISDHDVLSDPLAPARFASEVQRLAPHLQALAGFDLVLLPLALGNHVDHQIARDAGRLAAPSARTAFYEDLPYAARLHGEAPRAIRQHVASLTSETLSPVRLHIDNAYTLKRELASLYSSQIAPDVAEQIAAYADSLGGAECLHAPHPLAQHLQTFLSPESVA